MPIYEVKAPDGSILEIQGPEGATDAQLINAAAYYYRGKETPAVVPEEPKAPVDRTWGEAFTDLGGSLASGFGQLAQLPGQVGQLAGIYGPEEGTTGLQGVGKELEKYGQGLKSEQLKAKEAARSQKVGKAEGLVDEFVTAVKETALDPALMTSFFAEQVPNLIGSMGAGLITKGAVKLALRGATKEVLEKSAVRGMVGTNAVMQGADVGSDTYEQVFDRLVKEGMPKEKAAEIALGKARTAAVEAAAISVGTQMLPGGTTIERALVGRGLPRTGGILKGLAGEAVSEGLEEGGGKFASNLQMASLFPDVDVMKGVGEAAGMGALMGGVFGGAGGATLRSQAPTGVSPTGEPAAPQTPVPPTGGEAESEAERIRRDELERERAAGIAPVEPVVEPRPAEPAPTEPTAPVEPTAPIEPTAPQAQPLNTTELAKEFTNEQGQIDYQAFGNALGQSVYNLIKNGGEVTAYVNGEQHRIVRNEGEFLVDDQGNKISPVNFGGFADETNRIEYTRPEEVVQEPEAPPPEEQVPPPEGEAPPPEGVAPSEPGKPPYGVHPAEDVDFFDQPGGVYSERDKVRDEARNAAAAAGVQYRFTDGRIDPRRSTLDWSVVSKAKTGKALLDAMYDHVPMDYRAIIDRIRPSVNNVAIKVDKKKSTAEKGQSGIYRSGTHTAEFSYHMADGNSFDVMLHELVHGATVLNYDYGKRGDSQYKAAAKEMDDLARYLTKHYADDVGVLWFLRDQKKGGYENRYHGMELIARGLTNRKVQAELKKINIQGKTTGFNKFVSTVRKLLGLNPRDESALTRLIDLSEQLMAPTRGRRKSAPSLEVPAMKTPWNERETPDAWGREDALRGMYNRMQSAYDESYSPDEAYDSAYEAASNAEKYILRELKKDDFLGFDYPHQAIRAIAEDAGAYDLSRGLKTAISRLGNKVFSAPDIQSVQQPDEEPTPVQAPQTTQHRTITGAMPADSGWRIAEPEGKMPWSPYADDIVYNFVDKHVDMKRVIQAINKGVKKLDEMWDAYRRETLYHNRAARMTEQFMKNELKPLAQDMVSKGISEEELNNYLLARFAEERNNEINLRNDDPKLKNRGSGVHTLIARAYLTGINTDQANQIRDFMQQNGIELNNNENRLLEDAVKQNDAKRNNLQSLAKRVDSMIAQTQSIAVAGGLEKEATIESWRRRYPNYVPLRRNPDEMDFVEKNYGTGQGFSTRAGLGKAATGSLKTVDNILSNIILQRDMAISRAEKARIGRALYAMALSHPNPKFWLPVNPNASVISKANDLAVDIQKDVEAWREMNEQVKADKAAGRAVDADMLKQMQDLADRIKGKKERYADLSQQADRAKDQIRGELAGLEGEFGLDAKAMDSLIREPQGSFYNPLTGKVEYRTNSFLRNSPNVLAVPIDGETRYIFFNAGDERAKRMVNSLKNADLDKLGVITSTVGKYTRWISMVNTQYNPFFGIYNMIRDVQGAQFSLSSTPLAGKQMEVNSHIWGSIKTIMQSLRSERRGGEAEGKYAKAWQEFQDAGGPTGMKDMLIRRHDKLSVLAEEMRKMQETGAKKIGRKAFGAMADLMSDFNDTMENAVRLSAFIEAKKKFMAQHPGNEQLAIDKAAELAKNLTVNFNRKGAKSQLINSWFAFFNAAAQGTARLYETLSGPAGKKIMASLVLLGVIQQLILSSNFDDDDPPEFVREKNLIFPTGDGKYISWPMPLGFNFLVNAGRILTSAVEDKGENKAKHLEQMMSMMSNTFNPFGSSGLSAQTLAPTIADPFLAIEANKDAFGRPIYKEDRATQPTPGFKRSRESATTASKFIAEVMNKMSGGTEFQKGSISPTGDEIDFLAGQIGGGVWREGKKLSELVSSQVTGEELPPYRVPLAGRFIGDTGSSANVKNRFYQNVTQLSKYEQEIKGRAPKGTAQEFLKEHPEARLYAAANTLENEVSSLNRMRKQLIEQGAPKERLKQIEDKKVMMMRQFNEAYAKALKK